MSEEKLYTLDEARRTLAIRECRSSWHQWEEARTADGRTIRLDCSRCGAHAAVTEPEEMK